MARVVAYVPDLLFGSRVQADLAAAGHTVDLIAEEARVRGALADAEVLVVDLTDQPVRRAGLLGSLSAEDLDGLHTLAFYSHVDVEAKRLAEDADFDLVVPRSRMAREGAALVSALAKDEADLG
jgi:hypothetical protein